jgi:hypothetical protein
MKRIGPSMRVALAYIARNEGCCTAEVDRAVHTARNGHRWMYATVDRLVKAGLLCRLRNGARNDLYLTEPGRKEMGLPSPAQSL